MKLFILLVLIGLSYGRPQTPNSIRDDRPLIKLLRSESEGPNADGSYKFDFESEDGISRNEEGTLKDPDTLSVSGSYSFTAPDGTYVVVTYVADENGFRPTVVVQEAGGEDGGGELGGGGGGEFGGFGPPGAIAYIRKFSQGK